MTVKFVCTRRCQHGGRIYKPGEILRPGTKPNRHFRDASKPVLSKAPSSADNKVEGESSSSEEPNTLSALLEKEKGDEVRRPDAALGDKPSSMFEE
jgi:hypothetical protein